MNLEPYFIMYDLGDIDLPSHCRTQSFKDMLAELESADAQSSFQAPSAPTETLDDKST